MITDMNARVAMAQKLSIPQLQQAIKNGTVPAYVGVPLLQDKMRQQQQMAMAQQGQQGIAAQRPPIAEEIMAQAGAMDSGIDQLPSNLPVADDEEDYAGGGIVAFSGKSGTQDVKTDDDGLTPDVMDRLKQDDPNAFQRIMRSIFPGVDPRAGYESSTTVFTPSVKDRPFTPGDQTAGGASLPYRRQKGASNAPTPDLSTREEELLPPQDLGMLTRPEFADSVYGVAPPTRDIPTFVPPKGTPPAAATSTTGTAPSGATSTGTGRTTTAGATTTTPKAEATAAEAAPAPMSALDKYAEMLMGERANIAKDRQQARAMALVQAGLGVAGGTSPNPFANLAQGIIPATQAYQAEMKGIRKEDADRLKHLMAMGVSKEKLALEAKKLGITEKHYDQIFQAAMARASGAGIDREEMKRLDSAKFIFGKLLSQNPMADDATQAAMWTRAQAMSGMKNPAGGGEISDGVIGSYTPGKGLTLK